MGCGCRNRHFNQQICFKTFTKEPEYRRDMLYNVNPVGMVAFLVSAGLSIAAFFGLLGSFLAPYSPIIALVLAFVLTPIMGLLTKGNTTSSHTMTVLKNHVTMLKVHQ